MIYDTFIACFHNAPRIFLTNLWLPLEILKVCTGKIQLINMSAFIRLHLNVLLCFVIQPLNHISVVKSLYPTQPFLSEI